MSVIPVLPLRPLLAADALTCAVMGLGLVLLRGTLAAWTGLPAPVLLGAGLALLPIAAFIGASALPARPLPALVRLVVLGNAGWVLASLALILSGLAQPNALGAALVLGQAAAVAVIAVLEQAALGRQASAPA